MSSRYLRRSEARQAAEHLARAEAWLDQAAPELQLEIATIRGRLLRHADAGVQPTIVASPRSGQRPEASPVRR